MMKSRVHSFRGKTAGPRRMVIVGLAAALPLLGSIGWGQTDLTYENWAEGFFTGNCTGCHNSNLTGYERWGAPAGISFDTLEGIRQWQSAIRYAATGDTPYMPPSGGVWWWDRESLAEWLDAGAPGEAEQLIPVELNPDEDVLFYQNATLFLSAPLDGDYNLRKLTIDYDDAQGASGIDTDSLFVRLRDDDGATILAREWVKVAGEVLRHDYAPEIPILFRRYMRDTKELQEWNQSVSVWERRWADPGRTNLVLSATHEETWDSAEIGQEEVEDGVHLPFQAFHVTTTNRTSEVETHWWFMEAGGLIRRETVVPSQAYLREVTTEVCVFQKEEPLRDPKTQLGWIQSVLLPGVGEKGYSVDPPDLDYERSFEVREVGVIQDIQITATPTPTVSPTPGVTVTPTPVVVLPTPSADLNRDGTVDAMDLYLLMRGWQSSGQ